MYIKKKHKFRLTADPLLITEGEGATINYTHLTFAQR